MPFIPNSGRANKAGSTDVTPPPAPSLDPGRAPVAILTENFTNGKVVAPGFVLDLQDTSTGYIDTRTLTITRESGGELAAVYGQTSFSYVVPTGIKDRIKATLLVSTADYNDIDAPGIPPPYSLDSSGWLDLSQVETETDGGALTATLLEQTTSGASYEFTAELDLLGYALSVTLDYGDGVQETLYSGDVETFLPIDAAAYPLGGFVRQHDYPAGGTYIAKLAINSPYGTTIYTATATVLAAPTVQVTLTQAAPVFVAGVGTVTATAVLTFLGTNTYTTASIVWGDGVTTTFAPATPGSLAAVTKTHAYTMPAAGAAPVTYSVFVSASGVGGLFTSSGTQITISSAPAAPLPSLSIAVTETSSYAAGVTVTATFSASGQVTAQTLSWGDGATASPALGVTTLTHFYAPVVVPLNRVVSYTASGPGGTAVATATVTWPAPTAPVVSVQYQVTARTATTVTYRVDYTLSGGPATTLTVDYDDDQVGALPLAAVSGQVSHVYPNTTATHVMTFTATGPTGLVGIGTATINTTVAAPTAGLLLIQGTTPSLRGDIALIDSPATSPTGLWQVTAQYSVSGATSATLDWGDGKSETLTLSAASTARTYPLTPSGTYTVTLTAVNALNGLTATATGQVVIPAVAPTIEINAGPVTAFDGNDTLVTLTFTSYGEITAQQIDWGNGVIYSSPNGVTAGPSVAETVSYLYSGAAPGVKTIALRAFGIGALVGGPVTAQVTIKPAYIPAPPQATLTVAVGAAAYETGVTVTAYFSGSGLITGQTLDWGDGSPTVVPAAGVTSLTHSYAAVVTPTNRTITYTVTGPDGPASVATAAVIWPLPAGPAVAVAAVQEIARTPATVTYRITYTLSGGPTTTLTVDYDDGNGAQTLVAASGITTIVYPNSTATYDVTFVAVGPTGLTGVAVAPIAVTAIPGPTAGFTAISGTAAPSGGFWNVAVVCTAANTTTLTLDWGDGSTDTVFASPTGGTATHAYPTVPAPGIVTLTLSALSVPLATTATYTTDINLPVQAPVMTIDAGYPQLLSSTDTAQVFAVAFTSTGEAPFTSQRVDWGDGSAPQLSPNGITVGPSTSEVLTHSYARTSAGPKTVTLTAIGPGGTATATGALTVAAAPINTGISFVRMDVYNGSVDTALVEFPVDCSMPFYASDNLLDTSKLRVFAAGADGLRDLTQEKPAQYRVLSRWHKTRSDTTGAIKTLQVTFPATVDAAQSEDKAGTAVYWLQTDADPAGTPATGTATVTDLGGSFKIKPGGLTGLTYVVSKTEPVMMSRAYLGDGTTPANDIIQDGGSLLLYSDDGGARTVTVSSTVLECGQLSSGTGSVYNVKIVLRQTGTINDGTTRPVRYTARWTFLSGQADVEYRFSLHNPRAFHGPAATTYIGTSSWDPLGNSAKIARFYLGLRLGSVTTVRTQRAGLSSATTTLTGGQTHRTLQYFRETALDGTSGLASGKYSEALGTSGTGLANGSYDRKQVNGRISTEHLLSVIDGVDAVGTLHPEEMYPGAFYAGNVSGGVRIAVEHFAHRSPKSLEADADGVVRVGVFPDDFPGAAHHPRGWAVRRLGTALTTSQILSANPGMLPVGTNPLTGQAWRPNEFPPDNYPIGAFGTSEAPSGAVMPAAPGTVLNELDPSGLWIWANGGWPTPRWFLRNTGTTPAPAVYSAAGEVPSIFHDYYVLLGGHQHTVRVVFRAETVMPASVKEYADFVANPPLALSPAKRLRETRAAGLFSWAEAAPGGYLTAESATVPEPDLKRGDDWMRLCGRDAAATPGPMAGVTTVGAGGALSVSTASTSSSAPTASFNSGFPTLLRIGAHAGGQTCYRSVGWDRFGTLSDGSSLNNQRYDPLLPVTAAMQRFRTREDTYGAYRSARAYSTWAMDCARVLCDDPKHILTGLDFYETGFPHGFSSNNPLASHTFPVGLTSYYALTGDELAATVLRYAARPWFINTTNYDPSAFTGTYGVRLQGWPLRNAAAIYNVLGPLSVPTPLTGTTTDATVAVGYQASTGSFVMTAAELPAAGRNLVQVMLGGLKRRDDLQTGAFKRLGLPAGFVPDVLLSGSDNTLWPIAPTAATYGGQAGKDYSGNGVIFYYDDTVPSTPNGFSKNGSFSPFMELFCFIGMAETLRALDGATVPAGWTATSVANVTAATLLGLHRLRTVIRNTSTVFGLGQTPGFTGNVLVNGKYLIPSVPIMTTGGVYSATPDPSPTGLPYIRQRYAVTPRLQKQLDLYALSPSNILVTNNTINIGGGEVSSKDATTGMMLAWLFAEAYLLFSEYAGKNRADGVGVYADHRAIDGEMTDLPLAKLLYRASVRYMLNNPAMVRDLSPIPAPNVYNADGTAVNATPAHNGTATNELNHISAANTSSWGAVGPAGALKQMLESIMPGIIAVPAARRAAGELLNG